MDNGVDISVKQAEQRRHLGMTLSEGLISWYWVTLKEVTNPWRVIGETGYGHFGVGPLLECQEVWEMMAITTFLVLI